MSVGTAVIGSLQFGYNTGVINAPQKVSYASVHTILLKQHLHDSLKACFSLQDTTNLIYAPFMYENNNVIVTAP